MLADHGVDGVGEGLHEFEVVVVRVFVGEEEFLGH